MKRVFAVAVLMMLTAAVCAEEIDLKADTAGAYSSDTSTAGSDIVVKPGGSHDESILAKSVLLASAGYFNYAYIADGRLGYGLLFDSCFIAGTLAQHFSYDAFENRQNMVYEISGIVSSLGMAGLTYYPLYELYESYTNYDYRHTARGWIGCGVLALDMIILSSEKYGVVPVGFMYDGTNAEIFLNFKY